MKIKTQEFVSAEMILFYYADLSKKKHMNSMLC